MFKLLSISTKSKSLFIRLIASFLIIIALLVSVNYISFSLFKKNVYEEIISYNELNLKNTVDSYENHLVLIRNMLLSLSYSSNVIILGSISNPDFMIADQVRTEIESMITNSFLYLDNVFLYFKDNSYMIQKNNGIKYNDFLKNYYQNDNYNARFWNEALNDKFLFRIFPSADFSETTPGYKSEIGNFIPLIVNNRSKTHVPIIAFLDTEKLFRAFHRSINNNLIISDQDNRIIYSSNPQNIADKLPELDSSKSYEKIGDYYYFYKKGQSTNLFYIHIIPINHVSSQIVQFKVIFYSMLVLSIIISFFISVWLSIKFNNPIKKILESVLTTSSAVPLQSKIKEFEMISGKIWDILQTNQKIQEDLTTKNTLVQYYAYINKLKKIHTDLHDLKELHFVDKPYVLVLFNLIFKSDIKDQMEMNEERVTYYFREFIKCTFSGNFKDSHTFQMEKDQIMTILFIQDHDDIVFILNQMKQVFDIDKNYCLVTIAISRKENHSSQLTTAYQQTLRMVAQRELKSETQIIASLEPKTGNSSWTASQEQEFFTKLLYGNTDATLDMLIRALDQMLKKGAPAIQIYEFIKTVITKIENELASSQPDITSLMKNAYDQVEKCHSPEEMKHFLESFIRSATNMIAEKERNQDHIIRFVTDYLNEHLETDVSLDLLADKLNISGGYLSTYFKEKTGNNYMDYVNNLRIDRAKQMLQNYNLNIQEISEKIGYTNANSFIRMFKKYTGITPGEYRRKYSNPVN